MDNSAALDLSAPSPADLHNEPRPIGLKNERGKPLGEPQVRLWVRGVYSDAYQDARRRQAARLLLGARTGEVKEADLQRRLADDGLALLISAVASWENVLEGGAPAPCTPDRVERLLRGFPFVRDQLERFVHAPANFSTPASPSCSPSPSRNSTSTSP